MTLRLEQHNDVSISSSNLGFGRGRMPPSFRWPSVSWTIMATARRIKFIVGIIGMPQINLLNLSATHRLLWELLITNRVIFYTIHNDMFKCIFPIMEHHMNLVLKAHLNLWSRWSNFLIIRIVLMSIEKTTGITHEALFTSFQATRSQIPLVADFIVWARRGLGGQRQPKLILRLRGRRIKTSPLGAGPQPPSAPLPR